MRPLRLICKTCHFNISKCLTCLFSADDYIEMIIQFGYVTLFASAFPLAAFLAIFANLVEIRTDCWKLTHLFRRRSPVRTNGIGMWKYSLRVIAWLSATSNLFLFAFTSSQLRQWLPDYYHTDERSGQSMPNASSTSEILLIVMVIEHCIIILSGLVMSAIHATPNSVKVELQKHIWVHEQVSGQIRKQTVKRSSAQVTSLSRFSLDEVSPKNTRGTIS